ncbi:MAG: flavodoxin family protein [Verrucomicrobiota bacterium]
MTDPISHSSDSNNGGPRKLLILVGSPRRNGNCSLLAEALASGADSVGTTVTMRFVDDFVSEFLRDNRTNRRADGEDDSQDGFREVFFNDFLPADGVVFCSPIYWYAMSGQMKTFFDRTFTYYAASYPKSEMVIEGMKHKRIGLVLSSEETYPGVALGPIHQIQEYSRYTHSELVGVVRGVGNSRGDVLKDPNRPVDQAEQLGKEMFTRSYSDYRIDTDRPAKVWG